MLSFGIISGVLNLIGTSIYIAEIFRGKSSPERATWFIWSIMGIVAFMSQKAIGAQDSLWFVGLQTLGVVIVALLSVKYGQGGWTKSDKFLVLLGLIGIVFWIITKDALLSLIMVIIVRSIGVSATVIKTYVHPRSEAVLPWLLYAASAILAIISVGELNFELLLYPIYVLMADSAVMLAKYHKHLLVKHDH